MLALPRKHDGSATPNKTFGLGVSKSLSSEISLSRTDHQSPGKTSDDSFLQGCDLFKRRKALFLVESIPIDFCEESGKKFLQIPKANFADVTENSFQVLSDRCQNFGFLAADVSPQH